MTTSTPLTIECNVHFKRKGRGYHKELRMGQEPQRPKEPGRVPRVARFVALAIRFDQLIHEGVIANYAQLARLGHVTRARVCQIMNLLYLAPDIQEAILFLPRTERGRDVVILRQVLPIAAMLDWQKQRAMWKTMVKGVVRGKEPPFSS